MLGAGLVWMYGIVPKEELRAKRRRFAEKRETPGWLEAS
jgi:hypothetical protein